MPPSRSRHVRRSEILETVYRTPETFSFPGEDARKNWRGVRVIDSSPKARRSTKALLPTLVGVELVAGFETRSMLRAPSRPDANPLSLRAESD